MPMRTAAEETKRTGQVALYDTWAVVLDKGEQVRVDAGRHLIYVWRNNRGTFFKKVRKGK